MRTPRCSVILPTYNRAGALPRAVASVLAQDEPDFELIIVDDGSTDQTWTWLATLGDRRIRFARSERNQGPSAARNIGIMMASAPVLVFLDSDDAYCPNRLSLPLAVFAREPDVIGTLSASRKQDKYGQTRAAAVPDVKLVPPAFEWAMLADLVGVESTSITVRTEHARKAGGFDVSLRRTEDREFLIRLARLGALRVLPDILFEKAWSADSLSNEWAGAGRDLIPYFRARPEYLGAYRKLGHYLATKILVMHLRHRDFASLSADLRRFRAAGLLDAGLVRLWRDHVEVRRYRRAHASADALRELTGPPTNWGA
jgi:glycosyltransferase involved in cell wall biosynthesis